MEAITSDYSLQQIDEIRKLSAEAKHAKCLAEAAQKTAQSFATILNAAGVNFAVLGENEQCSGDSARRAGNEYLFFELATANVETLNEVNPKRIVTTCPHCLNTLKNEYPAFGGNYDVIHHSQLIEELMKDNKLTLSDQNNKKITFHDPCYLGRYNNIYQDPRDLIINTGAELIEMEHHGSKSFCCGGGGAQMWKEEEEGTKRVSVARFEEAQNSGAELLAVGCPFCLNMLTDAAKEIHSDMELLDIAEIIASQLQQE
jgi:Fe-S oxidoreductase